MTYVSPLLCLVIEAFRDISLQGSEPMFLSGFVLIQHLQVFYSIIFLAVIGAGGVATGSNPAYTRAELAHHIRTAKVNFLISEPEIMQNLSAAAEETGIPMSRIWVFDTTAAQRIPEGFRSWRTLLEHGEQDWIRFDDLATSENTTAARLFSSGTTGLPKAVMLSHLNLIAQHTLVFEAFPRSYDVSLFPYDIF